MTDLFQQLTDICRASSARSVQGLQLAKQHNLAGDELEIYLGLCSASEYDDGPGWRAVYLDNAAPHIKRDHAFAGYLSSLERRGLYRPIDNFAWGKVKLS